LDNNTRGDCLLLIVHFSPQPPNGSVQARHVLTERAADQHADPKMVATKLMRWSWELTDEQRGGLTTRQFTRSGYHLMRLQLGEDLTHIRYGNMPRRIASVEEVLALKPEVRDAR
jgi:hypothetical protein